MSDSESSKVNILVVDDDPVLLDLLVDTLTSIGYDAVAAPGGAEALDILKNREFDLMITDIKMPDVDGIQLLKKVRRYYSRMPVLFITGVASPDIIGSASPDGFLAKPFRISQIERLIEQALKQGQDFSRKPPRILIVDADEEFRNSLSDALSFNQCLPFHAADARDALLELEHGEIDAVIASSSLSDMDGPSFIQSIKENHPHTLAVLMGDAAGTPQESVAADAVLSKPFTAGEFLEVLTRHSKTLHSGHN
jgi:DNA-binding NtrC family response regulator